MNDYYVPPDVRPWWLADDDFDPEQEYQHMARGTPDDAPAIDPEDVIDLTHLPGEDADPRRPGGGGGRGRARDVPPGGTDGGPA